MPKLGGKTKPLGSRVDNNSSSSGTKASTEDELMSSDALLSPLAMAEGVGAFPAEELQLPGGLPADLVEQRYTTLVAAAQAAERASQALLSPVQAEVAGACLSPRAPQGTTSNGPGSNR